VTEKDADLAEYACFGRGAFGMRLAATVKNIDEGPFAVDFFSEKMDELDEKDIRSFDCRGDLVASCSFC